MIDPKRYILAGGTVVVALGIGFVMQRAPSPVTQPVTQTASLNTQMDVTMTPPVMSAGMSGLELSQFIHTAATPDTDGLDRAAPSLPAPEVDLAAAVPGLDDVVTIENAPSDSPQVSDCDGVLTVTPAPAAMVDLVVQADCLPQARVTVHHNGMMVQALTDTDGTMRMRAPALSREALFIASFDNGVGAVARAQVPDFDAYDRVVLQWRGDAGFQIHALEYGASYGEAGHIWHETPGELTRVVAGEGGALTRLGDPDLPDGLRAEVYTFPTGVAQSGEVVLTAEAVITSANCTRDVQAQALQVGAGGVLTAQELALTVLSCEVEGDILMLKNLLQDLKIARN